MALNDVTFVKGQGGLGRPLAGEDHISGLIFYVETPPSALNGINVFYSLEEFENLIVPTIANPGTGTQSDFDKSAIWYHVSEFFRIQPKGVLYLGVYSDEGMDFSEVEEMQYAKGGVIRQMGVFTTNDFAVAQLSTLQAKAEALYEQHMPLSILYAANISGVADLANLETLKTREDAYVSVVIGQDGNGVGAKIYNSLNSKKSLTVLGAALGAVSKAKVSENIGWVKNFNMASTELDVLAFANGNAYRSTSEGKITELNNKRYIFLRKHIGINGSFFNDSHTATAENSDYAYIENNRTIDKAVRNIRTFILPELNGPLLVDPDGRLSEDTIAYFTSITSRPLEQMQRDLELSAFQVIINPAQNVLDESKLNITVKLVPVGVARQISINIGFTVNIS
jgi:hypothetical protein